MDLKILLPEDIKAMLLANVLSDSHLAVQKISVLQEGTFRIFAKNQSVPKISVLQVRTFRTFAKSSQSQNSPFYRYGPCEFLQKSVGPKNLQFTGPQQSRYIIRYENLPGLNWILLSGEIKDFASKYFQVIAVRQKD